MHFAWHVWALKALRREVAHGSENYRSILPCPRVCRKTGCFEVVKLYFVWQAWDFVAIRTGV